MNPVIARRSALAAGLAGAGAVALAACSSGSSSSGKSAAPTAPQAPQKVAKLADIKVGQAIAAKLDGKNVLVSRPTSTTAVCFSAICTHEGCTVQPDGSKLICPCHESEYDVKTGDVLAGPAPSPLHKIAVTVDNGEVMTT